MSEVPGVAITSVLTILIIINIVGNALVCAIIKRNRDMRTPVNCLLFNLAIADIVFAAFIAPKIILSVNFGHPDGVTGTVLCKLLTGGAVAWIGGFSSIASLTAIAIERYYAVVRPFGNKWKLGNRELKVIIPGVWILSSILNIPLFLAMKVKDNFCVDSWPKQWMPKAYTLAVDFVVFVPLALMVFLYSRVVCTLWFKSDHGNKLTHQQRAVMKVRKRVTLMVITVSVIFGICWGTMQILYFLSHFTSYNIGPVTIAIVNTMVMFNSAVNPFVYALLSQQFREKMKRMICCTGCLTPTVQPRQVPKEIEPVTLLQLTPYGQFQRPF